MIVSLVAFGLGALAILWNLVLMIADDDRFSIVGFHLGMVSMGLAGWHLSGQYEAIGTWLQGVLA